MALATLNYWSPDGQLERSNGAKEKSSLRAVTLATPKQSSTPYHWPTPGYYKDKVKTSAVHHFPFTFDHHICDLPQHPLKLITAPQVEKPCSTT